ncbi:MAG: D-glycero-beta-D-manno-heptose 1-phosphate adenylyltransferase [Bacteroidales bacterium]|nr:D-glycero-beta-D-manno-heptose 1-phosphate adenylyltransferase [Bacteroidales bacterium]
MQHIFQQLKKNGKKIVFTNGCFDIVHPGHIHYLMEASELGDILVVAINSDDSVRRLKGPTRPIIPEKERCLHMASFEFVDYVLIFDEDTPENIIKLIQPDVLVKGSDYRIDEIAGASYVLQQGGKVITIPLIEGYSTTSLLRKLDKKS